MFEATKNLRLNSSSTSMSRLCTEYQLRLGKILYSFISMCLLISFFPFVYLVFLSFFHYLTNLFSDFLRNPFLPPALLSFWFFHFYLRIFSFIFCVLFTSLCLLTCFALFCKLLYLISPTTALTKSD